MLEVRWLFRKISNITVLYFTLSPDHPITHFQFFAKMSSA